MILILQLGGVGKSSALIAETLLSIEVQAENIILHNGTNWPDHSPCIAIIDADKIDNACKAFIADLKQRYHDTPYILIGDDIPTLPLLQSTEQNNGIYICRKHLAQDTLYTALKRLGYREELERLADNKLLFTNNPLPILVYDRDNYNIVAVNNAAINKYGYSKDEFTALRITDIRPEEDIPALKNAINAQNPYGYHDFGVWKHRKKDGTVFLVHVYVHAQQVGTRSLGVTICVDVDKREQAVSENRKLNDALQTERQRALEILSSVEEVLWTRDAETLELLNINPACEQIYGYKPEEMIGTTMQNIGVIHADDMARVEEEVQKTRLTGKADTEYRITDRNGNQKHLITKAVYHKAEGDARDTISGITIDVTELKNTQDLLREKAQELNKILDSITDGFFQIDKEWRFIYVNKTFEEVCNIAKEDILGKHYSEIFPHDSVKIFIDHYEQAIAKNEPIHFEAFSGMLNIWLLVNAYPYEGGLRVYFSDITEERELQERIKNSELLLRSIINNTDDIIWAVDRNLNITYANDMFVKRIEGFLNITPKTGDHVLFDFLPDDQKERYRQYYTEVLKGNRITITENHTKADGSHISMETSYYPIEDEQHNITGISCYMRDITERRNYIKKIEDANKRLQDIAWLQSHKVRSHTATILGMVQLYNQEAPDTPDNNSVIQGIKEASENLDSIIREITEKTNLQD